MSQKNIMIVEDHILTRMGTIMAINTNSEHYKVVSEAGSVKEAIAILKSGQPIDLILLDLMLPDGRGREVVKYLHTYENSVKVLVLSADNDKNNILQLLQIGIDGFVSKFVDIPTLLLAIESVCNGIEFYGKDIAEIIHAVTTANPKTIETFTSRERKIIHLCAEGLTAKKIANKLNISVRTVENHKNNIFKKMGFKNTSELIHYAYEHGIIHN